MLNDLHISRSVRRAASRNSFSIRFNADFEEVIQHCAKIRKPGTGTWITEEMIEAYTRLFHLGYAYSVVAYEGEAIAGGLYGVVIGKMVTGESMFYLKPDASKLALVALIEKLRSKGVEWLDCQQDTPLLRSFGAVPVPRERFVAMVNEACAAPQLHL
jgi:leucyl/phenylalanyl-tRNA--protein transferase